MAEVLLPNGGREEPSCRPAGGREDERSGSGAAGGGEAGGRGDGGGTFSQGKHAKAPRLEALDAPRWIASMQIVLSHFYIDEKVGRAHALALPDEGEWWYQFARYGKNWTQFFFILSGFVLAYAEMVRPPSRQQNTEESLLRYLRRRLISIYPTFLFSLLAYLLQAQQFSRISPFQWKTLAPSLLLMQSWVVVCGEQLPMENSAWSWNVPAWFLSALVVYWVILRPLARFFKRRGLASTCLSLLVLWAFSLVPGLIERSLPEPRFENCMLYQLQNGCLGYFHVFITGVATARLFVLTCLKDTQTGRAPTASTESLALAPERAPRAFRCGCCLGYLLYALYFLFVDMERMLLTFHNGGILPIMVLIVLGSALGVDPLAKYVFKTRLFKTLGQLSYAQYLMQMPLFIFFMSLFTNGGMPQPSSGARPWPPELPPVAKVLFPFALIAVGYLVQQFVQRPYTEWQQWRREKGMEGADEKLIAWIDGTSGRCFERCRGDRVRPNCEAAV